MSERRLDIGRCPDLHAFGVDSVPSSLGVLRLAGPARTGESSELEATLALVTAFRGGFSRVLVGSLPPCRERVASTSTVGAPGANRGRSCSRRARLPALPAGGAGSRWSELEVAPLGFER